MENFLNLSTNPIPINHYHSFKLDNIAVWLQGWSTNIDLNDEFSICK